MFELKFKEITFSHLEKLKLKCLCLLVPSCQTFLQWIWSSVTSEKKILKSWLWSIECFFSTNVQKLVLKHEDVENCCISFRVSVPAMNRLTVFMLLAAPLFFSLCRSIFLSWNGLQSQNSQHPSLSLAPTPKTCWKTYFPLPRLLTVADAITEHGELVSNSEQDLVDLLQKNPSPGAPIKLLLTGSKAWFTKCPCGQSHFVGHVSL